MDTPINVPAAVESAWLNALAEARANRNAPQTKYLRRKARDEFRRLAATADPATWPGLARGCLEVSRKKPLSCRREETSVMRIGVEARAVIEAEAHVIALAAGRSASSTVERDAGILAAFAALKKSRQGA